MVWGQPKGVGDWVERLAGNDPTLTSLTVLSMRKFGHEEVAQVCEALGANTVLTELYASGHAVEPQTAEVLAQMLAANESLRRLCIGNDSFGDQGVEALCKGISASKTLEHLDLEHKGLGPPGMKPLGTAIATSASLCSVSLARNAIGDDGAGALFASGLRGLKELDLRECQLGSGACQAMAAGLGDNSDLQIIQMDENDLRQGTDGLSALVSSAGSIRQLFLRQTDIGDTGMAALADAVLAGAGKLLSVLDISSCQIGPEGGSVLGDCLPKLTQLRRLILRGNQLGETGVVAIAEGLSGCKHLEELDVGANEVGGKAIASLAGVPVEKLCLFACNFGDSGAEALASAACQGLFGQLHELDVSGCGMTLSGAEVLLSALCGGGMPGLRVLVLGANPATQDDEWETLLERTRLAIPRLDIVWKTNDPNMEVDDAA